MIYYFILFWVLSGLISGNYIYYKIKFTVKNPDFPHSSMLVYLWMIFLGLFLGFFLFWRAQDEKWVEDLIEDLESV